MSLMERVTKFIRPAGTAKTVIPDTEIDIVYEELEKTILGRTDPAKVSLTMTACNTGAFEYYIVRKAYRANSGRVYRWASEKYLSGDLAYQHYSDEYLRTFGV